MVVALTSQEAYAFYNGHGLLVFYRKETLHLRPRLISYSNTRMFFILVGAALMTVLMTKSILVLCIVVLALYIAMKLLM